MERRRKARNEGVDADEISVWNSLHQQTLCLGLICDLFFPSALVEKETTANANLLLALLDDNGRTQLGE